VFRKKKPEGLTKIIIASCVRDCLKEKCPLWVVLDDNYIDDKGNKITKLEGKCAIAWLPQMFIELKQVLTEIRDGKKKD